MLHYIKRCKITNKIYIKRKWGGGCFLYQKVAKKYQKVEKWAKRHKKK